MRCESVDDPRIEHPLGLVLKVTAMGFDAMMKGAGDVVTGWDKLRSAIANITPAGVLAEMHRGMAQPKL
jgi:hypothetical protein